MAKKKKAEKPPRQMTRRQLSHYQKQKRRQRFVFFSGITVITVIVLLILVGWLVGEVLPLRATVIEIDTLKYDMQYFIDAYKALTMQMSTDAIAGQSNAVINQIQNSALLIWGAAGLGIKVSDDEAEEILESAGIEVNDASKDIIRAQILPSRLNDEYFSDQVPVSDNQVNISVMLLESESQANEIRQRLQGSDNFSALAEEFSLHSSAEDKGEIGWHTKDILVDLLGSFVPGNYAFSAKPGDMSEPLYDKQKSKQVGYWLLKVLERPDVMNAQVQGILLGSEEEAYEVKEKLAVTDNLSALIAEYSQHESKNREGHLGLVTENSTMQSPAVNDYIFDEDTEIGVWSEPVRDDTVTTIGGYWLVKVIDKDDDREISEEDRSYLVDKAYSDWFTGIRMQKIAFINITPLTPEKIQWAIEKVLKSRE